MSEHQIPFIAEPDIMGGLASANSAEKRRYPKILHKPGAEFNEVFNFMMEDSYMQPHLHPGPEKCEEIFVIRGKLAILYFDDQGNITDRFVLEKGGQEMIRVPSFKWHTYIMLTDTVVTYETMMGKYEPSTWKHMASWAPTENTAEAKLYWQKLKSTITT